MSTHPPWCWSWKDETQCIQLSNRKPLRKIVEEELDIFFNRIKFAVKVNLFFVVQFEKYRSWNIQIFLRTSKQNPAGPIDIGVHQGWLDKT